MRVRPASPLSAIAAAVAIAVAAAVAPPCNAANAAIFAGKSVFAATSSVPAKIYFTAVAWDSGADGARRPRSGSVRAVLRDPQRRISGDFSFPANALGAVSGYFVLPQGSPPGGYSIELPRQGAAGMLHVVAPDAPGDVPVQPLLRDGLSLSIDVPNRTIVPGEKVSWRIHVAPADGSAPCETMVAASLCETDAAGRELPGGELAFFFSRRRAAPDGTFLLSFAAPAKRTFWRLSVFAHDAALRTGAAGCSGIATLPPLSIGISPPPFLRCGDEAYAAAAVSNNTPCKASASVSISLSPAKAEALEIPPASNAVIRIPVKAPAAEGTLKAVVTASIHDGGIAVGRGMEIPVLQSAERAQPPAQPAASGPAPHPEWRAIAALERLSRADTNRIDTLSARLLAFGIASHFAETDPALRQMFDSWSRTSAASGAQKRLAAFFDAQKLAAEIESAEDALADARLPSGLWPWIRGGGPDVAVSLAVFGHAAASLKTSGRLPGIPLDGLLALDSIFADGDLPPGTAALAPEYVRIRSALAGVVPLAPRHQPAFAVLAHECAAGQSGEAASLSRMLPCEKAVAAACCILEGSSILPPPPKSIPDAPAPERLHTDAFSSACFVSRAEDGFVSAKIAIEAKRPLERICLRYERAANETPVGDSGPQASGGVEFCVVHGFSSECIYIPRLPAGAHMIELRFRISAEGRFAPGWLAPATE